MQHCSGHHGAHKVFVASEASPWRQLQLRTLDILFVSVCGWTGVEAAYASMRGGCEYTA